MCAYNPLLNICLLSFCGKIIRSGIVVYIYRLVINMFIVLWHHNKQWWYTCVSLLYSKLTVYAFIHLINAMGRALRQTARSWGRIRLIPARVGYFFDQPSLGYIVLMWLSTINQPHQCSHRYFPCRFHPMLKSYLLLCNYWHTSNGTYYSHFSTQLLYSDWLKIKSYELNFYLKPFCLVFLVLILYLCQLVCLLPGTISAFVVKINDLKW